MCGIICQYNSQKKINLELIKYIEHRGHESYGISYFEGKKIRHDFRYVVRIHAIMESTCLRVR